MSKHMIMSARHRENQHTRTCIRYHHGKGIEEEAGWTSDGNVFRLIPDSKSGKKAAEFSVVKTMTLAGLRLRRVSFVPWWT
jgi:hypothetical protein